LSREKGMPKGGGESDTVTKKGKKAVRRGGGGGEPGWDTFQKKRMIATSPRNRRQETLGKKKGGTKAGELSPSGKKKLR